MFCAARIGIVVIMFQVPYFGSLLPVLLQEHFTDPAPSVNGSMKYILYRESNHLLINRKKMTYLSNLRKNSLDNEAN